VESLIAEKYALALFEAAGDAKAKAVLGQELSGLHRALAAQSELGNVLEHPRLPVADKLAALGAVLSPKPSPILERFLGLLIDKKRAKHLSQVVEEYQKLLLASEGKAPVRVLTPTALTAAQRDALVKRVKDQFGVTAELREEVRPDLVGGMILYLGEKRLDATVLGQLERLKQELMS